MNHPGRISRRAWLARAAVASGFVPFLSARSQAAKTGLHGRALTQKKNSAPREKRPNILLIVWDTARRDRCSLYGYDRKTTPNLERYALGAVVYDNAYVTSNWTIPSHGSIFTGIYPSWHGATGAQGAVRTVSHYKTLMEVLSDAGYQTHSITANANVARARVGRGFEEETLLQEYPPSLLDKRASIGHPLAAKWLVKERDESRPFFLYLNSLEPHAPYDRMADDWLKTYLNENLDLERYREGCKERGVRTKSGRYERFTDSWDERDFQIINSFYDANIAYLDMWLNVFFKNVKASAPRLMDNTVVILTSDHGEMLGEHGLVTHHGGMYDELCKIPLLIRYPEGTVKPGRVDNRVTTLDLSATILDLIGLSWPDDRPLQGQSLLSNLPKKRTIFMEDARKSKTSDLREHGPDGIEYNYMRAILDQDLKYVWKDNGFHQLFDLSKDPHENRNLIGDQPQVAMRLAQKMETYYQDAPFILGRRPGEKLTDDDRETLEGLGYLQ